MSDQQLELFRECVKEYVDITNQIAEASRSIKAVRQKKDELGTIIHEFMSKNNYEVAASGDVKLILKQSTKALLINSLLLLASLTYMPFLQKIKIGEKYRT